MIDVWSQRDKVINNLKFQGDGEVNILVGLSAASKLQNGRDLEKIFSKFIGEEIREGRFLDEAKDSLTVPSYREGNHFTDIWGCEWFNVRSGMEGQVVSHPLTDSSQLSKYVIPDISRWEHGRPIDWEEQQKELKRRKEEGLWSMEGADRYFERVYFLMGLENMMINIAEGSPFVEKVIGIVLYHNVQLLNKILEIGPPDIIAFGDDFGMQHSLMIGPVSWRKYFKPGYRIMYGACKNAGSLVYMHTDGYVVELFDDFIDMGVDCLNIQAQLNGVDIIEKELKGKLSIRADFDRQWVMPYGTPKDVKEHIKEIVMKLGSPKGGLEIYADIYPDTPLENIEALFDAIKEYRYYWVGR